MAGVVPGVPAFCASTEPLNSAPSNTADNTMNRSKRFKDISSVACYMFNAIRNILPSVFLFNAGVLLHLIVVKLAENVGHP